MVSLVQCLAVPEYEAKGWFKVRHDAPWTMNTPIGGPTVMANSAGDFIQVMSDGSAQLLQGVVGDIPENPA